MPENNFNNPTSQTPLSQDQVGLNVGTKLNQSNVSSINSSVVPGQLPQKVGDSFSVSSDSAPKISTDKPNDASNQSNFLKGATPIGQAKPADAATKEAIDIYVMPKEFQKHNRVVGNGSKTTGIVIMTIGIVILLGAGSVVYFYLFNPNILKQFLGIKQTVEKVNPPVNTVEQNNSDNLPNLTTSTTEIASSTEELPLVSPKDSYLTYNKGLFGANSFLEYYNLIGQYGSEVKKTNLEAEKAIVDVSPEKGGDTLNKIKLETPLLSGGENIQETIGPDNQSATLKISLTDGISSGVIDLVLENKSWKISNEAWDLKKDSSNNVVYKASEDRDNDQFTDIEEDLFGTNKESADTDGDTYLDGSEVMNLYNPNGKDQLFKSGKISDYYSSVYHFRVLYPKQWTKAVNETDSNQGDLAFNIGGGHNIIIKIETNSTHQSIDDYYKGINSGQAALPSQKIISDTWIGISSKDELVYYITDLNKERIYIFSYVPGDDKSLDYIHIFKAMVKSLIIK